ncbi:MAG: hypothetical protein ACI9Y7_003097 [Dokdonia sp.]|jgi:hypothetical protein
MKIFISHSSKDKSIIDNFVDKILILGCGIDENEIFCTSIEGLGIKTGVDFREHIKSNLLSSDYSFLFISNNYKESDICLNEMGASWAQESLNVKPFIFPNISFDSIGTLYSVKQVSKLNDSSSLDELFDELTNKYKIKKKISRWNKNKESFLNFIKFYSTEDSNNIQPSPNDFFGQFVKENASLNHLFLKCHPTLLDCKKIFSTEHFSNYFEYYCKSFANINETSFEPLYPSKKHFRVTKTDTMKLLNGINNIAGGMVDLAKKGVFNYNIDFYRVDFLENKNSELGISYKVFCYVNERWVFIPKPWR